MRRPWKARADGGRAGSRTRERVARLAVFKTAAFVRSATLPRRVYLREHPCRASPPPVIAAKLPPSGEAASTRRFGSGHRDRLLPMTFEEMETALRRRLEGLPPAARAELLHVLRLPDFDRADRIGEFWASPETRSFGLAADRPGGGQVRQGGRVWVARRDGPAVSVRPS